MQEITSLKKVICVNLDVHLWSGRAKLRASDVRVGDGGALPPEDLASLGSKKIVNPEDISKFEALKKEAERECSKIGVKFLGGYAIPTDKAKDLAAKLDEIGVRFDQEKAALLSSYDTKILDWVAAHPGWESAIQSATIDRNDVDKKLQFGWQAFRIVEAGDENEPADVLNKGLATTAKGLAGQLYYEISQQAGLVMEKSILGRDKVTQKILSPIRTIRSKLLGLSFIDKRVKPLIETIDHVLEQLPAAGHIEGLGLAAISGLVFILSSEDRMINHGEMVLSGKPVDESFQESVPGFRAQAAAVEEVIPLVDVRPVDVQQPALPLQPATSAPAPLQVAVQVATVTAAASPVTVGTSTQPSLGIPAIPPLVKGKRPSLVLS